MTAATASARGSPAHDEQVSGGGGGALINRGGQARKAKLVARIASLASMHLVDSERRVRRVAYRTCLPQPARTAQRVRGCQPVIVTSDAGRGRRWGRVDQPAR